MGNKLKLYEYTVIISDEHKTSHDAYTFFFKGNLITNYNKTFKFVSQNELSEDEIEKLFEGSNIEAIN